MKNFKSLNWLVLMAVLLISSLAVNAQTEIFRMKTNFSSVSKIDIQGGTLNVSVYGADRTDVLVSGFINGMESQKGLLKIETKLSGDVLAVTYVGGDSFNGVSGEIRILVPQSNTSLNTRCTSGNIDIMSLSGNVVDVMSVSGNVMLMDIKGNCKANSNSGKVSASKITGNLKTESLSGDIAVSNVVGNATFLAGSGAITGANITGNVSSKSGSASTKLVAIVGDIEVRTASGTSEIDDATGKLDVTTASGSIVLDKFSGYLDCESASGDIKGKQITLVQGADLSSISGSILVQIVNQNSELSYELSSASGKVVAKNVVGERSINSGTGAIKVKASTISGDLIIE